LKLFGPPKDNKGMMILELGDVWNAIARTYNLETRLAKFPNKVLYGEIYGAKVQDLTYDAPHRQAMRVFDVFDLEQGRFLDWHDFIHFVQKLNSIDTGHPELLIETVPLLEMGPWSPEFEKLAEGPSTLHAEGRKPHMREGIVIKPAVE